MALQVPSEPKIQTTVYSNFKGVDFTNDSTNVYKLRSPDGLNMIPDMDGSPRKRHGWEIAEAPEDFIDVYCDFMGYSYHDGAFYNEQEEWVRDYEGDVKIDKLAYFEIGGVDYILAFTDLGLFSYCEEEGLRLVSVTTFDHTRSFFFEGQGTAGFYMFNGLDLYMFDGGLNLITPYIPTTHIACTPTLTSSTMYENVNLLTAKRYIQYMGDGQTTSFSLPSKPANNNTLKVYKMTAGDWDEQSSGYSVDYTTGIVNFTSAPASSTEDNVRIVYEPDGSTLSTTTETVESGWKTITIKRTGTQIRRHLIVPTEYHTQNTHGMQSYTATTSWVTTWNTPNETSATFDVTGLYNKQIIPQYLNGSSAATLSGVTLDLTSYANKAVVKAGSTLYNSPTTTTSDTTTYGNSSIGHYGSWHSGNTAQQASVKAELVSRGFTSAQADAAWNRLVAAESTWLSHYGTRPYITVYRETRTVTRTKTYKIRVQYTKATISGSSTIAVNAQREAFKAAGRAIIYGNGIINQVFIGASEYNNYSNRIWYSAPTDPSYFPDLNYIEVGANDSQVMGMMKVGEYLGIIKQGSTMDSSIYLAYPTSFNDETTYAIKQKVAGVGAISNGAFNVLNDEPLFLSKEGVMAIIPSENEEKQLKNRSYYVNKRLLAEDGLENAISFVYRNMYLLAINNHVYVLDGAQKSSWANERTNLQYECYYWDNIPAKCFARIDDELWFADEQGNLCRFKDDDDGGWFDAYSVDGEANISEEVETEGGGVQVYTGYPVHAVWSTIMDDDGAPQYFKNLQKKGSMVILTPASDSGVNIYLKADNKEPVRVGTVDAQNQELPIDVYTKKKIKKYKRLQFICENDGLLDSFGVDQIIKVYTVGNYSKNR